MKAIPATKITEKLANYKIICENCCGQIISYKDYANHLNKQCIYKLVTCKTCGAEVYERILQQHQQTCQSNYVNYKQDSPQAIYKKPHKRR